MFAAFILNTVAVRQTNYTSEWQLMGLGSCIKSKKTTYTFTLCTKSASKHSPNRFATFGTSVCQGSYTHK